MTCQLLYPSANTREELIFTNTIVIIGFVSVGFLIGSATNAIAEMQAERADTVQRLQRAAGFLKYKKIGEPLRSRILSYYSFLYTSVNSIDETSVLEGLPRALRLQVSMLTYRHCLVQLPTVLAV